MSVATEFAPSVAIPDRAGVVAPVAAPTRLATVTVLGPVRPETPPLRLTRRGVVALALLVGLVGLTLVWLARLSAPASSGPATVAPQVVSVAPGDTLWSIASRVAPGVDPRDEVARLQRVNHLDGVDLVPGQQLRVP
jgi:hypothetical protein